MATKHKIELVGAKNTPHPSTRPRPRRARRRSKQGYNGNIRLTGRRLGNSQTFYTLYSVPASSSGRIQEVPRVLIFAEEEEKVLGPGPKTELNDSCPAVVGQAEGRRPSPPYTPSHSDAPGRPAPSGHDPPPALTGRERGPAWGKSVSVGSGTPREGEGGPIRRRT